MFRFKNAIVTAAIASAVIVPAGAARAESSDSLEQLKIICTMKTGDFYVTPYQLARCQDTRSNIRRADSGLQVFMALTGDGCSSILL